MHGCPRKLIFFREEIRKYIIIGTNEECCRKENLLHPFPPITIKMVLSKRLFNPIAAQYKEHSHKKTSPHIEKRRNVVSQQNVKYKNTDGRKALQRLCICSREHLYSGKTYLFNANYSAKVQFFSLIDK
jgi:hypothetical protein